MYEERIIENIQHSMQQASDFLKSREINLNPEIYYEAQAFVIFVRYRVAYSQ